MTQLCEVTTKQFEELQSVWFYGDMPTNLTIAEVAALCEVSTTTVRNWIKSQRLPARRLFDGPYRVALADLEESSGLTFTREQVEAVKQA